MSDKEITTQRPVHESWAALMSQLSQRSSEHACIAGAADPQLHADLPAPPDDTDELFEAYTGELSDRAKAVVHRPVTTQTVIATPEKTRWILVEVADGEWPVTKVFTSPTSLARRIAQLDGKDVTVLPFYGVPVAFTQGPLRHLITPAGDAIPVPLHAHAKAGEACPASSLDYEIQEDGYLGVKALSHVLPMAVTATADSSSGEDDTDD